ncbi:MAG: efflux RND transporter periplasmic adaptor subunit [Proteobacteria bacterium]|nr:efflux RND transporter periplasmic adaptor subunit [Pseudomonadota bacterium]
MKLLGLQGRTRALVAVMVPLLALFVYVGLRSGPLAPIAVTAVRVESRAISPALFGIGTVEARYTYKIGPTFAGRVSRLEVHVGDVVSAGQVLGEMDPIDLDDRVRSQGSAFRRSEAAVAEARARQSYAQSQFRRYEKLLVSKLVSDEAVATKHQGLQIADAALAASREDLDRSRSDRNALVAQRSSLRLIAPVAGVVVARDADPGTTVVAGQAVVEVIDPENLWINVRFDQLRAAGLANGQSARIVMRSRAGQALPGHVMRVEPKADSVTEETLAKVVFEQQLEPMPPLGELVEVTVDLPRLAAAPVIPNAAIRRNGDQVGVWQLVDGELQFSPVTLGASDLDGHVQVVMGLADGDEVVLHSEKALSQRSRIHLVERIPGVAQ